LHYLSVVSDDAPKPVDKSAFEDIVDEDAEDEDDLKTNKQLLDEIAPDRNRDEDEVEDEVDEDGNPKINEEKVARSKLRKTLDWVDEQWDEYQIEGLRKSHPILSLKARRIIFELHAAEPDYWTPIRLSNLFKMNPHYMKILLWDMRIEFQDDVLGIRHNIRLHVAMERRFGVVDYPDNIPPTPDHIYRKQTKRTFFYIPPEIPSNLLLEHLNNRDSKNFREGVKVAPRKAPSETVYPPMLVSGLRREYKEKNLKVYFVDMSHEFQDIYEKLIFIKDQEGIIRDATWDERKEIRGRLTNSRHYEPTPYNVWNDRGETPTEHTPPPGFTVKFDEPEEIESVRQQRIDTENLLRKERSRVAQTDFPFSYDHELILDRSTDSFVANLPRDELDSYQDGKPGSKTPQTGKSKPKPKPRK